MRKTKIVATIGPASNSEGMLGRLIDAGMNVARLNFSHGTHEEHAAVMRRIRKVAAEKKVPVAVLQDLAGPKIRIGKIAAGTVQLKSGEKFVITSDEVRGDSTCVSSNYKTLPQELQPEDQILLADGSIELRVTMIEKNDIICKVIVGGELSSNKGLNLPSRTLAIAAFTDKDRRDLDFGLEQGVDYVAMSFVRRPEDIEEIKKIMLRKKISVPIIAKIEKHEAIKNIDAILAAVDGIMVARGDLAVETSLEKVPLAQKMLIQKCNQACKPVITATQMLKSMVESPRPTRAEANDVANAVIDGTDAVMLSEETTIGHYPVEAVATMARIVSVAEDSDFATPHFRTKNSDTSSIAHAVSYAAFQMAQDLGAAAILTPTQSGSTARMISSYRPSHPIIAISPDEQVVRQLNLVWGVYPLLSDGYFNAEELIEEAKDKALTSGLVKFDETVVITAGVPVGIAGTTNLIKIEILK